MGLYQEQISDLLPLGCSCTLWFYRDTTFGGGEVQGHEGCHFLLLPTEKSVELALSKLRKCDFMLQLSANLKALKGACEKCWSDRQWRTQGLFLLGEVQQKLIVILYYILRQSALSIQYSSTPKHTFFVTVILRNAGRVAVFNSTVVRDHHILK